MNHCKHFHFDGVMHTPCPQCEIDQLRAENERLKAELAEAKKDAERYRWLRHGDNDEPLLKFSFEARCNSDDVWLLRNDELDAAIDAAMKGK